MFDFEEHDVKLHLSQKRIDLLVSCNQMGQYLHNYCAIFVLHEFWCQFHHDVSTPHMTILLLKKKTWSNRRKWFNLNKNMLVSDVLETFATLDGSSEFYNLYK